MAHAPDSGGGAPPAAVPAAAPVAAAVPAAAAAPSLVPGAAAAPAAADAQPSVDEIMGQLRATLEAQRREVDEARATFAAERGAFEAERGRLAASGVQVSPGDIVELNVGGRLLATTRRTLCLVPDSLLSSMFSGRWCDAVSRDEAGRRFLDLDPDLFDPLLSWLRFCSMAPPSHGAVVPEPAVPAGKTEAMLALLDFLCLQKYIPITYQETFCEALRSRPGVAVAGDTATRVSVRPPKDAGGAGPSTGAALAAPAAARVPGAAAALAAAVAAAGPRGGGGNAPGGRPRHQQHSRGGKPDGRALLLAAGLHGHFDVRTHVTLEVLEFGESVPDGTAAVFGPQFVGFMRRAALEALPLGEASCKPTWASGCYGWWTGGAAGYVIADGVKNRHPCSDTLLWHQGDHLELTIDCRHDRRHCLLGFHNTVTSQRLQIDTVPRATAAAAEAAARRRRASAAAAAAAAAGGAAAASGGGAGGAVAAGVGAADGGAAAAAAGVGPAGSRATGAAAAAAAAATAAGDGGAEGGLPDPGPSSTLDEWTFVVGMSRPGDKLRINRARRQGMRPA